MRGSADREQSVEIVLAATAQAPAEARAAFAKLGDQLARPVFRDGLLLVSEVVTNSVRHAANGPDSRIHLRARADRGMLRVDVWDWGPGFAAEALVRRRPDDEGGFGFVLVRRLATRWSVERDRATRVWFEIDPPYGRTRRTRNAMSSRSAP
jgi:anti-sigma regulatory factor (Ser/Thr protein kinase)